MNAVIRSGTDLTIHGIDATITSYNAGGGWIEYRTEEGKINSMDMKQFHELWSSRALKLRSETTSKNGLSTTDETTWQYLYTEEEASVISRKLGYIKAVTRNSREWIKETKYRKEAAKKHADETNDKNPPSDPTIRRWFDDYRKAKWDLSVLRSGQCRKGNRRSRFSEKVVELINHVINEYYLKPIRPNGKHVYEYKLKPLLLREGVFGRARPSYKAFMKVIKKVDEYEKCLKRYGYHQAKNDYPSGGPLPPATFVLERVEIDHTPLDIVVVDSEGNGIGRPWLTLLIDAYSRMVIGFFVSTKAVNRRSVLKATVHAIKSKDYVREKYPQVINEWPCFGTFTNLVTDNGMDLHAMNVKAALYSLRIDYTHHAPKHPTQKGTVERFFRTLNEELMSMLPGKTFSNYQKRKGYDSEKEACVTLETLNELLHMWIVDIYHTRKHRTLGDSPLNVWRKSPEHFKAPKLPNNAAILDRVLMESETRRLQKYGVDLKGVRYNSEDLMQIARRKGFKAEVKVFYDPDDLMRVTVLDPAEKKSVEAILTNHRLAKDKLNLEMLKAYRNEARKDKEDQTRLSEMDLIRAREKLDRKIEECKQQNRKRKGQKSKLHKHDEERDKTSDKINRPEKMPLKKESLVFDDSLVRKQIGKRNFEPF